MQSAEEKQLSQDLMDAGSEMESVRQLVEPMYEDVRKYVTPWMTSIKDDTDNPPPRVPIFDSTAVKANRRMGNGLMGFTMNPSTRWFIFGLFGRYGEPLVAADIPGAAHWLRQVEDAIFGIFSRSNFYQQAAAVTSLAGAYGAPTLWCEPPRYDGQAWAFINQHPKQVWFSEDDRKWINHHRRSFWLSNRDCLRLWSQSLGDEHVLVKGWKNAPAGKTKIFHHVYPNDEFDPGSLGKRKMKLRSVYLTSGGDILENGGLDYDRNLTWRWQVDSDQVYPGSPAMDAMPDIKTLQQMRRTLLQSAQQFAEPPVNAPDSMRNKVRLAPGSINYYDKPENVVSRMSAQGNYPIPEDSYRNAVKDVDDVFYGNLWLMLERQSASARLTAYQVSQMVGEKANVLGPVVANHQSEFADPLISLIFNVEMKAGRLPPPPIGLRSRAGVDGKGIRLIPHYIGPLNMAQRRNGVMDGFMTALSAITPVAQIRAEVLDHLDWDKWVRMVTVSSGAPEEVVNGMDRVMAIRQGRLQQAQANQAREFQLEMLKNLKGLNQAPEDGSMGASLNRTLGIPERTAV